MNRTFDSSTASITSAPPPTTTSSIKSKSTKTQWRGRQPPSSSASSRRFEELKCFATSLEQQSQSARRGRPLSRNRYASSSVGVGSSGGSSSGMGGKSSFHTRSRSISSTGSRGNISHHGHSQSAAHHSISSSASVVSTGSAHTTPTFTTATTTPTATYEGFASKDYYKRMELKRADFAKDEDFEYNKLFSMWSSRDNVPLKLKEPTATTPLQYEAPTKFQGIRGLRDAEFDDDMSHHSFIPGSAASAPVPKASTKKNQKKLYDFDDDMSHHSFIPKVPASKYTKAKAAMKNKNQRNPYDFDDDMSHHSFNPHTSATGLKPPNANTFSGGSSIASGSSNALSHTGTKTSFHRTDTDQPQRHSIPWRNTSIKQCYVSSAIKATMRNKEERGEGHGREQDRFSCTDGTASEVFEAFEVDGSDIPNGAFVLFPSEAMSGPEVEVELHDQDEPLNGDCESDADNRVSRLRWVPSLIRLYMRKVAKDAQEGGANVNTINECQLNSIQSLLLFRNECFGGKVTKLDALARRILTEHGVDYLPSQALSSFLAQQNTSQSFKGQASDVSNSMLLQAAHLHDRALKFIKNQQIYEAIEVYEQYLMQFEKGELLQNGDNDWREIIGTFLHNIGVLHLMIGEYGIGIDFFDKTIKLQKEVQKEDEKLAEESCQLIANTLNNIGSIYFILGEIGPSLEAFSDALEILRAYLVESLAQHKCTSSGCEEKGSSSDHIETALHSVSQTLCNMAYVYVSRRSHENAVFLMEEASSIQKILVH